ncbi:MAG: GAF domain-containing protein [Armatimonadetes bacterium]|nr:GAF domain-containing protein [Armatimonadota bacterium]
MSTETTPDRRKLEDQIRQLNERIAELERTKDQMEAQLSEAKTMAEMPTAVTTAPELEHTLGRLVKKIAMILQAEKCVFMLHDTESGELVARKPALGLNDEQIHLLRVRATQGISGEVFRDSKPLIVDDAASDDRTVKENVVILGIRSLLTVPLVMEKRDEQERVVEKRTIGVLHVFNKRFGASFSEEDVRLLSILARQAAAVIANAQLYIEIAEKKQELEATLRSLLAGVLVVGINGRLSLVNAAAQEMLGINSSKSPGMPFREAVPNEKVCALIRTALSEQRDVAEEIDVVSPTERVLQAQTAMVRSENGESMGVVAIFNDITEIRNVDRMKTAFVSTVSHELRTPLTSIKGFISTLLSDTEGFFDDSARLEFYQIIDQECDRLTRLISDLLNVSRIESGRALEINWKPVDVPDIVTKVINAQKSYTDRHEFPIQFPDGFPRIMADQDKFDQILTNLLSNAVKYSPRGGQVAVRGEVVEGEMIQVSIMDQGIGIPADKLTKVFERFERIDNRDTREAGGTGIGLYLVKHLVEAHGGSIWVESDLGKGSTFIFKLPIQPPRELTEQ